MTEKNVFESLNVSSLVSSVTGNDDRKSFAGVSAKKCGVLARDQDVIRMRAERKGTVT